MLPKFAVLLCLCLACRILANGSITHSPRDIFKDLGLPMEAWPAMQPLLGPSLREQGARKEPQPSEHVLQQAAELTDKIVASHHFHPSDSEEIAVIQEDEDSLGSDVVSDHVNDEMAHDLPLLDRDSSISALQGLQKLLSNGQRWRIIDFLAETLQEPHNDADETGLDTVSVLDHLGLLSTSPLLAANLTIGSKPDFVTHCSSNWRMWPGKAVSTPTGKPFSTVAKNVKGCNPTQEMVQKGEEVRKRFGPKKSQPAMVEVNASESIENSANSRRRSSTRRRSSRRRRTIDKVKRRRRRNPRRRAPGGETRRRSGGRRRRRRAMQPEAEAPPPEAEAPPPEAEAPPPAPAPKGSGKVHVAPTKPKEWPKEKPMTPPSPGPLPTTGCVAQTEWRPVAGSEDCSSRYVERRDEIPGFTPREGSFSADDLQKFKGKAACGKTCPRKYLIGQYWWPRELQASGPEWDDAQYWCASNRGEQLGTIVGALAFYSKNGVCEIFSECPLGELEDAAEREHQKYELCPMHYESTKLHRAANGDDLFIPVGSQGLCTRKVFASDAIRKCYVSKNGGATCIGEDYDQHRAIQACMNGGGEYDGKDSDGRHQCLLKSERSHTVNTWIVSHGQAMGRKYKFEKHPKCNINCGRINNWHISPSARYSRLLVLPQSQCGECRTQMKFCAQNTDGYTSFAGYTYGNEDTEVLSAQYKKIPHKKGDEWKKGSERAFICCNIHVCSSSMDGDWKDAKEGGKPCEENPGNLRIKNPLGTNAWIYGRYTALKVEGNSAPSTEKDGNKCFQLKKHFRPHSDWVHWVRTGESKEQLCYPRHEEVPVKGSTACQEVSSASKCLSKPGICKWVPPEEGECRPKVVAGSEHCESAATTCPSGGHDGKPCEPPEASTGCDYPWYAEQMKDLPEEKRRFTSKGAPKHHAALIDSDVGPWAGLHGSISEYNTTWHTLQEHGWKGSSGKCITKVYSTSWNNQNGRILGHACKAKLIEHPEMAWNGEPCMKASTNQQCAAHSDVCDWKPGPKCEFRLFHEMQLRCLHCKNFDHNSDRGADKKAKASPGGGKGSWCSQCTKWQLYYSKGKSELACHILQHFHGLGPEMTSRIDVIEGYATDHNKAPDGAMEFVFDGKRTCVRAKGGVKFSQQRTGRDSEQKGGPSKDKTSHQIETFHKSREVCQGGIWRRWTWSTRNHKWILLPPTESKRRMEVSGLSIGPWVFERCGYATEGSAYWKQSLNSRNFYETMEALAEAVKNGGVHPECPVPDRAVSEEPPVTPEAATANKAWMQPMPCNVANMEERRDARKEPAVPMTPPQPDQPRATGCSNVKMAQGSRAYCESLFEMKDSRKAPCIWVPNAASSPYGFRCFRCDEVSRPKESLDKCGPGDEDAPKKCHVDCVIPASWPSRQSFTQYAPCTKFINPWGFCGCDDKFRNFRGGGQSFKGIDCRGCSEGVVQNMIGKACSEVAPNLSPALCLALQALGTDDSKIATIIVQPHWAHGGQYYFGDVATCIAAGQPQRSCAGQNCFPNSKVTNLGCRSALYCAGGENVIASGYVKEDSYAMGSSYGSWAAQARQLARAIENGGEHPHCIAATARTGGNPPCLAQPPAMGHRRWPGTWADTWWHPTVTKKVCDEMFRHAYPATLQSPDSFSKPWSRIVAYDAWRCENAGYPVDLSSLWGPDDSDKKYSYQHHTLYHREVFGLGICTEHKKNMCGDVAWPDANRIAIPGCRRDALSERVSCGNGGGFSGRAYQCLCEDLSKGEDEANWMKSSAPGANLGGQSCNKAEMEQGVIECFGPLSSLKPGETNDFGFRCKKDEAITEPFGKNVHNKLVTKFECPTGSGGVYGWCSSATNMGTMKSFGRFTLGSSSTPTCVRSLVRCNGVCNCEDCSDEDRCDDLLR